jgi:hypothetical protein
VDEVVLQLQKATGCDMNRNQHHDGSAHALAAPSAITARAKNAIAWRVFSREIRLQVEVDCD